MNKTDINTGYKVGPFKKVILLGGNDILIRICKWLHEKGHDVAVITSPRQSFEKIQGISLERLLEELPIKYTVTEKLDDSILSEFITDPNETFFLSIGAAWIFNDKIIKDVFNDNLFNLHGTRLPQYRGGGGFSWQILTGNRFGYCNIHKLKQGIDEGEIIFSREFLYPSGFRIPKDYSDFYTIKNLKYVTEFLGEIIGCQKVINVISQPEYLSSYWPRLNTEINGWIDWSWKPHQIERFICAFDDPYIGAHTIWNGNQVYLKKVSINLQDGHFHPYQSGIVYRKNPDWICIAGDTSSIVIEEVFNKDNINILNEIKVGDRFHTPLELLDKARDRVFYSPKGIRC